MNKDYIRQYATLETTHWWFLVRQKILEKFLEVYCLPGQLKILNIGAAGGASSRWLAKFGEVTSVENEPAFIEHLRSEGLQVDVASVICLPYADNQFDLVCAFDVLEHVQDDKVGFEEMTRVCKYGGAIFITVPAYQFLWSNHDEVNGHMRRYARKSFLSLASGNAGLQLSVFTFFNTILFLPVALARKIMKRKAKASDFETFETSRVPNWILGKLFSIEVFLLRFMRFPFGVSMLGIWRKQQAGTRKN